MKQPPSEDFEKDVEDTKKYFKQMNKFGFIVPQEKLKEAEKKAEHSKDVNM